MHASGFAISRNNTLNIVNIMSFPLLHIKCQEISSYLNPSKCHDHDIAPLHQPIRLQHFKRSNEEISSMELKTIKTQSCQPMSIKMRIFSTENEDFDTKNEEFQLNV